MSEKTLSINNNGDLAEDAINENLYASIANKTSALFGELSECDALFNHMLLVLNSGSSTVELRKRFMLKAIDEIWVKVIEESLYALDDRIRNYSRFIEENEEVLPIELSRNITSRSLQHLSQHTEYIQKIEGDQITPSRILNVFHDETIMTYENRFVNTLINRLYAFVTKRYMIAKEQGLDEKNTVLSIENKFEDENVKGKISLSFEIAEQLEEEQHNSYVQGTPLWERVERIYNIITAYNSSEFIKQMGKNYIRPPVMRTNAILKNKNLRQCLALWEFISSYNDTGYGMLIQEDVESVDEDYLKEVHSYLALQYLSFQNNIENEFDSEKTLDSYLSDTPFSPEFISEVEEIEEAEFNVFDTTYMKMTPVSEFRNRSRLSDSEREIMYAIDITLAALPLWEEHLALLKREEEERIAAEKTAKWEKVRSEMAIHLQDANETMLMEEKDTEQSLYSLCEILSIRSESRKAMISVQKDLEQRLISSMLFLSKVQEIKEKMFAEQQDTEQDLITFQLFLCARKKSNETMLIEEKDAEQNLYSFCQFLFVHSESRKAKISGQKDVEQKLLSLEHILSHRQLAFVTILSELKESEPDRDESKIRLLPVRSEEQRRRSRRYKKWEESRAIILENTRRNELEKIAQHKFALGIIGMTKKSQKNQLKQIPMQIKANKDELDGYRKKRRLFWSR